MRIAPIADVKARLSAYLDECGKDGPLVITRNGKAAAVLLVPSNNDDLEHLMFVLADCAPGPGEVPLRKGAASSFATRGRVLPSKDRLIQVPGAGRRVSLVPGRYAGPDPVATGKARAIRLPHLGRRFRPRLIQWSMGRGRWHRSGR
jgi:prevent-host-death family protein